MKYVGILVCALLLPIGLAWLVVISQKHRFLSKITVGLYWLLLMTIIMGGFYIALAPFIHEINSGIVGIFALMTCGVLLLYSAMFVALYLNFKTIFSKKLSIDE